VFGNFELYWPLGLTLDDRHTFTDPVSCDKIGHFQSDEIAAAKLAVDREVKQRQVPEIARKFKSGTNGPHLFREQRAFLANEPPLVLGPVFWLDCGKLDIGHEKSSTLPSHSTRQHNVDEPILSESKIGFSDIRAFRSE